MLFRLLRQGLDHIRLWLTHRDWPAGFLVVVKEDGEITFTPNPCLGVAEDFLSESKEELVNNVVHTYSAGAFWIQAVLSRVNRRLVQLRFGDATGHFNITPGVWVYYPSSPRRLYPVYADWQTLPWEGVKPVDRKLSKTYQIPISRENA